MIRNLSISALTLVSVLGLTSWSQAQVFVRAPFVRVFVNGPDVHVRAPFVNINVPGSRPLYMAPAPVVVPGQPERVPAPAPVEANAPAPVEQPRGLTLSQFANSFQPKAGNYEVALINPVTGVATPVRFTLPEGTHRRVNVFRRELEFDYGPRQYVRIQFDRDGASVITR